MVFILTACDGEEALDRLESVLEGMEEQMGKTGSAINFFSILRAGFTQKVVKGHQAGLL